MTQEYLELSLLAGISQILTRNSDPEFIAPMLNKIFSEVVKSDKLNIFMIDENTRTLRDYSKSWVIIDEIYDNITVKRLYTAMKNLANADFILNDRPHQIDKISSFEKLNISDGTNSVKFPLMKNNKAFGFMELIFTGKSEYIFKPEFFATLSIASYQISLKIQNKILADNMQCNIEFHEAMKNIAKIIETQYELIYIIPLIGEMIDKFISQHLIYIFLKVKNEYKLVWPLACRDKSILNMLQQLTADSDYILSENGKIGAFPLVGEKEILGCLVAYSNEDKLTKKEADYLEQLAKQSSITIYRANMYAEVLQHATLDALTSLNNRRQFEIRLRQEVAAANRQKRSLCAIMLDVDFFKKVNDTYGHMVGDEVLKTISHIIQSQLRESDIPSRYGGEEFAILLPDTKLEEAHLVAERLRSAVEKHSVDLKRFKDLNVDKINITVSIGVHEYIHGNEPEELYSNADKALYKAKTHGRNKVVVFNKNDN